MQFRKKKTFQLIFIKLQVFRVEMKMVIITHYHILMFFSFFLFNLLFQEGWTHSRYTFLWHCQNKDFFKVLKKMYDHIFQFDEYREKNSINVYVAISYTYLLSDVRWPHSPPIWYETQYTRSGKIVWAIKKPLILCGI